MSEHNQNNIDRFTRVDPFVYKNGEVAYFVAQPHGTKQEWARNSGLETINGGLEWATSGAEDYFDEVTEVRGVMDYNLFGLGIPYHLHVALNKAEGGQFWWNQTKTEGYGGNIFAAGDVTMTLRDSYGHHILNKPDTPDHQEEILRRLYIARELGSSVSYDAGFALGVLGINEVKLCTVHSQFGTINPDVPMDKIMSIVRSNPKCTGGIDWQIGLREGIVIPSQKVKTHITEWGQVETSILQSVLPQYADRISENNDKPPLHLITSATPHNHGSFEIEPDEAVNQITLGCIARGLIPRWNIN